jgi:hypothetical protein
MGSGAVLFSIGWSGVLGIALLFLPLLASWSLAGGRQRPPKRDVSVP